MSKKILVSLSVVAAVVGLALMASTVASGATMYLLTVTKTGTGSGIVTSSPGGINCGSTCGALYSAGTLVRLFATPGTGSVLAAWGGACAGTSTHDFCEVTMDSAKDVTVTFDSSLVPFTLSVNKTGRGSGTVTSRPAGIDCGADCSGTFGAQTVVTLTAVPGTTSVFAGWTGACSGSAPSCRVLMNRSKTVIARFDKIVYTLTVTKTGIGTGIVGSSPAGISCGPTCTANFDAGSVVTLHPMPAPNSIFVEWSGDCTGTGACSILMDGVKHVNAKFTLNIRMPLTVIRDGRGTVTSNPAGINCGYACNASYLYDTAVTLTATPQVGYVFAGWGGDCTGMAPTCVVTMNTARRVTARFTKPMHTLTVIKLGTGAGIVTSAPGGISCGPTCAAGFEVNSTVMLFATPATGSHIAGWSGDCSGWGGSCTLIMDANKDAYVTFNRN